MNAIILCGGFATRLGALTKNKPKPLLQIGKKPIVEHIIHKIREIKKISTIYIVANNKFYNQFITWSEEFGDKKIIVVNNGTNTNEERLGAVGDLNFIIQRFNLNDETLVIAGDNLAEYDLVDFKFFFQSNGTAVAVKDFHSKEIIAKKYGVVEIKENIIIDFEEKPENPKSTLGATACYFLQKEDFSILKDYIKDNPRADNLGDFIKFLSEKKNVYAFIFNEAWFDIGSIEQLQEANRRLT